MLTYMTRLILEKEEELLDVVNVRRRDRIEVTVQEIMTRL